MKVEEEDEEDDDDNEDKDEDEDEVVVVSLEDTCELTLEDDDNDEEVKDVVLLEVEGVLYVVSVVYSDDVDVDVLGGYVGTEDDGVSLSVVGSGGYGSYGDDVEVDETEELVGSVAEEEVTKYLEVVDEELVVVVVARNEVLEEEKDDFLLVDLLVVVVELTLDVVGAGEYPYPPSDDASLE